MGTAPLRRLLRTLDATMVVGAPQTLDPVESSASAFLVGLLSREPDGLDGTYAVKIAATAIAERERAMSASGTAIEQWASIALPPVAFSRSLGGRTAVVYPLRENGAADSPSAVTSLANLVFHGDQHAGVSIEQTRRLCVALSEWYAHTRSTAIFDSCYVLFKQMLGGEIQEVQDRLVTHLPGLARIHRFLQIDAFARLLPNPTAYLWPEVWQSVRFRPSCPRSSIHGDLRACNVMCFTRSAKPPQLIGLGSSSWDGIPFIDLATLELDLLLRILDLEHVHTREMWVSLMNVGMRELLPPSATIDARAKRAWNEIVPIRRLVRRLTALDEENYAIVWWLAATAAGLARSSTSASRHEASGSLLYAAFALDHVLNALGIDHLAAEPPIMIPFVHGGPTTLPPAGFPESELSHPRGISETSADLSRLEALGSRSSSIPAALAQSHDLAPESTHLLARAGRIALAICVWRPEREAITPVAKKRRDIIEALSQMGHHVIVFPSHVPGAPREARVEESIALRADLIVVLLNDSGAHLQQALRFLDQPEVARKTILMLPKRVRPQAELYELVSTLHDMYGAVYWYEDHDISDCHVLTQTLRRVEARRLTRALHGI